MARSSDFIDYDASEGDILLRVLTRVLHFTNTDHPSLKELKNLKEFMPDVPITLYIGGLVVVGNLITETMYLELLEADMLPTEQGDLAGAANNLLPAIAAAYKNTAGNMIGKWDYVHMRDVRIYSPNGNQIGDVINLWRGRGTQIDGFAFGDRSPSATPPLT